MLTILAASLVNFWIWKIFSLNIFLAVLVLLTTSALYIALKKDIKKYSIIFTFLFMSLIFAQYKTTEIQDLTYLDNDEQRVQQERLKQYPPTFIKIANKTLWLKMAHWFEERKETIIFFRIQKNLGEALDINSYFFGAHPRARIGINEIKKFPFVLLPFFILGLLHLISSISKKATLFSAFILPIVLISIIGHKNTLGPFTLFPAIAVCISEGLRSTLTYVKNQKK